MEIALRQSEINNSFEIKSYWDVVLCKRVVGYAARFRSRVSGEYSKAEAKTPYQLFDLLYKITQVHDKIDWRRPHSFTLDTILEIHKEVYKGMKPEYVKNNFYKEALDDIPNHTWEPQEG